MGFLDRWLSRFLSQDAEAPPAPPGGAASQGEASRARPVEEGPMDALDALLSRDRGRLTLDDRGRRFAESDELLADLATLDEGGRSRAADHLLADALLVSPAPALRRRLAERLIHRGDREEALVLLEELTANPDHATFAFTRLGEVCELEGDTEGALRNYEQVLALDVTLEQPKARARRLRAGRDERQRGSRRAQSALTRFLGARAAGARYAVLEEIGRGGAATVFRARDRVVEREVALKIYHPRGKAAERRERLVHEARIAASFDHPHIVPILDVDAERDFLVMGLCDGGSLRQRLQRGRLPLSEAAERGAILLRTLADVHEAGRCHLDVKPSNLLLHEGRVMLCDFGTAGLVEMGAAAGTRAYMAPEQRARGEVGPAADLYAAGLLVFECLTGHLPTGVGMGRPDIELTELPAGPARRALERLIDGLCAPAPDQRIHDGRDAARRLLEAASLPHDDKQGVALKSHLEMLAQRQGDAALQRVRGHPLVTALTPPAEA